MSHFQTRPSKKRPKRLDCDGCGCGDPDCSSCCFSDDDIAVVDRTGCSGFVAVGRYGDASRRANSPPRAAAEPQVAMRPDQQPSGAPATRTSVVDKDVMPTFKEMVDTLDEKTVRATLVRLASMAPSAQTVIRQVYTDRLREREKSKQDPPEPVDFDHFSKKAWHALHTSDAAKKWDALGGDGRTTATKRALDTVVGYVQDIQRQVYESSSFDEKLSALETIRKILKSILLGSNELAKSVRSLVGEQRGNDLGAPLRLIVECMTTEQLRRAAGTADEKGTLVQKFRWCWDEARKINKPQLQDCIYYVVAHLGDGETRDALRHSKP